MFYGLQYQFCPLQYPQPNVPSGIFEAVVAPIFCPQLQAGGGQGADLHEVHFPQVLVELQPYGQDKDVTSQSGLDLHEVHTREQQLVAVE